MSWLCLDNNMLMWSFGIALDLLTIVAPCDNPIFQVENRDDLQVQWSTLNVPKASILLVSVCQFPHWHSFTCNITQWQPRCWRDFLAMDEGTWSHPVWKYTGRDSCTTLSLSVTKKNNTYITIYYHILPYITIYYHIYIYILPYISYICRQSQSPNTKSHRFLRVPSVFVQGPSPRHQRINGRYAGLFFSQLTWSTAATGGAWRSRFF